MSAGIECRAYRRGQTWVAHVPEHGVYGHGRTLKAVRASIIDGLAHIGVTTQVTVVAETPELDNLRSIEHAYTTALLAAVTSLALCSTTLGDIALATGAPAKRVKALLAELRVLPADVDPASTPGWAYPNDADEPSRSFISSAPSSRTAPQQNQAIQTQQRANEVGTTTG
ncbi:hypothetical protein [Nocardia sp. NPDC050710]|uniref:hypothetical protein n=1 Tax=Nocardia sp. NPDC050710 TaxID=3157220 RepID=UPI0033F85687